MAIEPHVLPDPESSHGASDEQTARLIALIGRENRQALDSLYDLWAPTLLGIAARMLGNHQEAEEAVRETFVKIWHRAADHDSGVTKPFVWCFTILRGICIETLGRQKRQKFEVARHAAAGLLSPMQAIPETMFLPLDTLRSVRRELDQLPLDERRCLELGVFLEYAQTGSPGGLNAGSELAMDRLQNAVDTLFTQRKSHET